MSVSLVYYGVSYSSVDLGWNPYLTFALTGLIEFPSNLVAIWTAERYEKYNLSLNVFFYDFVFGRNFIHDMKSKKLIVLRWQVNLAQVS